MRVLCLRQDGADLSWKSSRVAQEKVMENNTGKRASRQRDGGDGYVHKPKAHKADLEGAVPCVIMAGLHRHPHVQC